NMSCTSCKEPCRVQATESSWLAVSRCTECGGPWPRAASFAPDSGMKLDTGDSLSAELASTPLESIGLRAGASVSATLPDGRAGRLGIQGDIRGRAGRAVPQDPAATDL